MNPSAHQVPLPVEIYRILRDHPRRWIIPTIAIVGVAREEALIFAFRRPENPSQSEEPRERSIPTPQGRPRIFISSLAIGEPGHYGPAGTCGVAAWGDIGV